MVAMKDITELNESQRRLRMNEHRLRSITENLPHPDRPGRQERALRLPEQPGGALFGKPLEQLLGF
ncbi:hypothetical protein LP420_36060 [Massilia sp. B-10]|nr:hypothetical protein LP420_36060 [Massilia sp. B-10]